ncbi:MAG: hypothetical protein HYS13_04645, partial [Planctomycetia bacterium]|nr:hypothetical protein [Planctomycetia bacterium]
HDLWAAADLPPLAFSDRLSLVAAGFDLTFRIEDDGRQLRLSPIGQQDLVLVREYPAGAKPADFARQVRDLLPDAKVDVVGKVVRVSGTAEDHERLDDARRRGRNPAASPAGKQLYSLNAPNVPLRTILEKLSQDQKLEFRVDEKLLEQKGLSLDVRVNVKVKDVELDALLKEAFSPAGLTFRRSGKVVEVAPAKP